MVGVFVHDASVKHRGNRRLLCEALAAVDNVPISSGVGFALPEFPTGAIARLCDAVIAYHAACGNSAFDYSFLRNFVGAFVQSYTWNPDTGGPGDTYFPYGKQAAAIIDDALERKGAPNEIRRIVEVPRHLGSREDVDNALQGIDAFVTDWEKLSGSWTGDAGSELRGNAEQR
jgi:hypothetical protein